MKPIMGRSQEEKKYSGTRSCYVTDLNECERLWKAFIIPNCVSDLWEFRLRLHNQFNNKPCFLVVEDSAGIGGMMPLSFIADIDTYVFFPGEIWEDKTWLERTPFYIRNSRFLYNLITACPDNIYLRYLELPEKIDFPEFSPDETGYVIYPRDFNYDLSQYDKRFSRKKSKAIKKVIQSFESYGCRIYYNRLSDFNSMVEMSLKQFGRKSFMYDIRFRNGFREIMNFMHHNSILRMISCEIGGELAAVDIGAVFNGIYTVFIGGTNPEFPGIAKLMNMNHIDFCFRERLRKIDFLCGDFHWKKLWHLDSEKLWKFKPSDFVLEQ